MSIVTDFAGNIYVTGETQGGMDGNTNAGSGDAFVAKYNSAGERQWQWTKQFGTPKYDCLCGVATDSIGNIYVVGWTEGGLDGNTNAGESDAFAVKFNPAGEKQWTRQFGTPGSDEAIGIVTDAKGNIYVVGDTYGGLDGNTNAGGRDAFIVKFNSAGEKQ